MKNFESERVLPRLGKIGPQKIKTTVEELPCCEDGETPELDGGVFAGSWKDG